MAQALKLMCVLAHPDDESLGMGGTLAKYAEEGVETYLVTATRGERGWRGREQDFPGLTEFGKVRERELLAAARVLGIRQVEFLDYIDGEVDRARPMEAIGKIAAEIRRVRPHVVVTFGPDGGYGHPDHIGVAQFTTAALVAAANANFDGMTTTPHRVSKFYYRVWTREEMTAYETVFGELVMEIDGSERRPVGWMDWEITTRLNTAAYWRKNKEAVAQHSSQEPSYRTVLGNISEEHHRAIWGMAGFYRAFSLVNGGRALETDLFEGLRRESPH